MNKLIAKIEESTRKVVSHPVFQQWAARIKWEEGDLLVFNNSFVFRDVKTTKSSLYLACTSDGNGAFSAPKVALDLKFNIDFKRLPRALVAETALVSLREAARIQLDQLGNLAYFLIGHVDDSVIQSVPLTTSGPFEFVTWNPKLDVNCKVEGSTIYIRETSDEDNLWQTLVKLVSAQINQEDFKQKFGEALDKLQDRATANLNLPRPGIDSAHGVTALICKILKSQKDEYANCVARLPDSQALNEVLRIAYNFASDATNYIRLIVSICDLKPIVLWGTIADHFVLSEKFKQLPWTRRNRKPSLGNYESTIKDARNSAFHNLFPFRKSLSIHLPTDALGDTELRLFSEHSKKKDNTLNYQDKPLVDVLVEFTRAREIRVAERFWRENISVMEATIALFESTDALLHETLQVLTSDKQA